MAMHLLVWQQTALLTPKVYFLKSHWVFCLLILESELFSQKIFGRSFLAMSLTWATVYNIVTWGNIHQADRSYLHRHYIKDWHGDGVVHFETCMCDISTLVSVVWLFFCIQIILFFLLLKLSVVVMQQFYFMKKLQQCKCKINIKSIITGNFIDNHFCSKKLISPSQVCWIRVTNSTLFRCISTVYSYADDLLFICLLILSICLYTLISHNIKITDRWHE